MAAVQVCRLAGRPTCCVAALVPIGAGQVKLSYQKANVDGTAGAADVSDNDGYQLGLGYVHNLSKRTALYATYSRISNSGDATFVVPGRKQRHDRRRNLVRLRSGIAAQLLTQRRRLVEALPDRVAEVPSRRAIALLMNAVDGSSDVPRHRLPVKNTLRNGEMRRPLVSSSCTNSGCAMATPRPSTAAW